MEEADVGAVDSVVAGDAFAFAAGGFGGDAEMAVVAVAGGDDAAAAGGAEGAEQG